jgi:hypothetical protein
LRRLKLLARGHIKMLNIHLGPKISCSIAEVHSTRRPVVGKKILNVEYPLFGPKDQLHSSEVHSIEELCCWQEDTLKC